MSTVIKDNKAWNREDKLSYTQIKISWLYPVTFPLKQVQQNYKDNI